MQPVHQTSNLFEAHLVKHALEDAGIPAFVLGESLLGGMGELPMFCMLRVCVPDTAKAEAEELVALFVRDAEPAATDDDDEMAPGLLPA